MNLLQILSQCFYSIGYFVEMNRLCQHVAILMASGHLRISLGSDLVASTLGDIVVVVSTQLWTQSLPQFS